MKSPTVLGGLDPDLTAKVVSRREAMTRSGRLAGVLAIASLPAVFGVFARRAFAQGTLPAGIVDVLNFALTLEYLEDEFYRTGLDADIAGDLDLGGTRAVFAQISKHETAHVALLQSVLGADAVAKPTFDFTAGGTFGDVFTNPGTFITLAQGFEDTGVRAYKGQAGNLIADNGVLTTALRIHSVEARHASAVRRLAQSPAEKGWITLASNTVAALDPVYAGEELTTQGSVDLTQFGSAEAASEAFDEPLSREDVEAIAGMFIVS
ncbi:MAG TPA: ferritin-like domain-containing protein [Gemmatimonadales bacterium]|nr:ferritin-like domain-containing protein [Gemmatimonadales bacterium]